MKKVLLITSSLFGESGNSAELAQTFKAAVADNPALAITERDLVANPLPHLDATEMQSWMTDPAERTPAQQALASRSDQLIEELQAHDLIVLAVPMYNLGIPSQMKAYLDRLARAGVTFKYTENGPVGLVNGKQVLVLAARGGVYAGSDMDAQTPYLKSLLGLMGMTDVRFVYAEGLNMGEEPKQQAMAAAKASIRELADVL
ncbi:FMN-dependent NADH-azoreductase [Gallaecimonas sp. GXIMD1310]|uniref:FMN-dependent NADH-azoreductase n=1 Tax=Gallaecimonas sp. GXIMD1310 TaxID=3131926 RepID=UPI0032558921